MSEMLDENMYTIENSITKKTIEYLMTAAKWGTFLAVIGYISIGLFILLGFITLISGTGNSLMFYNGVVYLIFGILYYFPTKYLYDFSSHIKNMQNKYNTISMEEAMSNLKSLFKFMGITTVILISFYLILLIFIFSISAFV
jgi:hypothetical protein